MAVAIPIIGLVLSAYGMYAQGEAQDAAAQSQANIYERDSQLAEANAAVTLQQASANEESQRREARRRLGAMRGQIAQSGTGLMGSNADIYSQSARDAELDALNIRYGGIMESKGLMNQSTAAQFNAKSSLAEGKAAKQSGYIRAGTTLITGGNDIYNTYKKSGTGG